MYASYYYFYPLLNQITILANITMKGICPEVLKLQSRLIESIFYGILYNS